MATTTAAAPPPYVDPWAVMMFTLASSSPANLPWACPDCPRRPVRRCVKLDREVADTAAVVKRPRPKFFRHRDPEWRNDIAFRLGFPILGVVAAVALAWLINQV
jgi:hypothetical protein